MTLSVAVMAHPSRQAMVDELLTELDREPVVVWDQIQDRHDTGIRAIEAFDTSCTHHLVIQDDVQPCRDLIAGVERSLAHVPEGCPASFYLGKVRPFGQAVNRVVRLAGEASWIVMDGIYWGPAIVVPTAAIPALSEWYRSPKGERVTNYDRRTSTWFHQQHIRCWYSWPSLVDHRGDESLVRKSNAHRRAHRFLGADESALDVDWTGRVLEMNRTDRLDAQRQRSAARAVARFPA